MRPMAGDEKGWCVPHSISGPRQFIYGIEWPIGYFGTNHFAPNLDPVGEVKISNI